MALQANLATAPVFKIAGFPIAWMRPDFAAAVTLDTNITLGVAGLAGLQVPAGFSGMFTYGKGILLTIGTKHQVRFDPE